MPRNTLPAIGLSGLLLSSQLSALELGNIRILSAEGEPFKADIELYEVGDLRPLDIAVKLASESEYKMAQLPRASFLEQLQYEIILNGRDGGVIHVSSPEAVAEEEWQLLIDTRWPSGRQLKQYLVKEEQRSFSEENAVFVQEQTIADAEQQADELADAAGDTQTATVDDLDAMVAPQADAALADNSEQTREAVDSVEQEAAAALPIPQAPLDTALPEEAPIVRDEEEALAAEEPLVSDGDLMDDDDELAAEASPQATLVTEENVTDSAPEVWDTQAAGYDPDSYTTVRGDALWRIASRYKPSEDISIYQALLAFQQLNPDAFVDNNVNRMKTGAVLRIPSETDILSNSFSAARSEIVAQIESWEAEKGIQRQIDARPQATQVADVATSDTNASLLLSTDTGSGMQTAQIDDTQAQVDQLRDRLETALSELDKAQRMSAALSDEVVEKDALVQELRNQLEVVNAQLAELQARFSEGTDQPNLEPEEQEPAPSLDEPAEDLAALDSDAEIFDESADPAAELAGDPELEFVPADEAATPPSVETSSATDEPIAEASSEGSGNNWWMIAGGAGILGALAYFLLGRRRTSDMDELDEHPTQAREQYEDAGHEQDASDDPVASAAETASEEEFETDASGLIEEELSPSEEELEITDPLREADIYLAYGRFAEAADLLENALQDAPEDSELLEKLKEVHLRAGDNEEVERTSQRLAAISAGGSVSAEDSDQSVSQEPNSEEWTDPLADLELDLGETESYLSEESQDELDEMLEEFETIGEESPADLNSDGDNGTAVLERDESFNVLEEYDVSMFTAQHLLDKGDDENARVVLESLISQGTALEKQQARELLRSLDG